MKEPIEEESKLPARVASGIPQDGIMGVGKLVKETAAPSVGDWGDAAQPHCLEDADPRAPALSSWASILHLDLS